MLGTRSALAHFGGLVSLLFHEQLIYILFATIDPNARTYYIILRGNWQHIDYQMEM